MKPMKPRQGGCPSLHLQAKDWSRIERRTPLSIPPKKIKKANFPGSYRLWYSFDRDNFRNYINLLERTFQRYLELHELKIRSGITTVWRIECQKVKKEIRKKGIWPRQCIPSPDLGEGFTALTLAWQRDALPHPSSKKSTMFGEDKSLLTQKMHQSTTKCHISFDTTLIKAILKLQISTRKELYNIRVQWSDQNL